MKARANQDALPRTWALMLEVGQDIPPMIEAQLRTNDQVVIREYPKGYLGQDEKTGDWAWGQVYWHGGASIIRADGSLEKVRKR